MTPQAVAQAQLDAYNAHDVEALCALYADDACQYRHPDILLAQGRQAIRQRYAERFASSAPSAQLLQRIVSGNTVVDSERVHEDSSYTELLAIYEVMHGQIAKAWFRNGATTQLRTARHADIPVMEKLIARSGIELSRGFYSEEQAAAVTKHVFGVDSQLVEDETYFIIERDGAALACGGWSKRATLFGGDQHKSGPDPLLDPATQPARIRAFFVDPSTPRQGLGTMLMQHCEREAAAQGFQLFELAATMPGVPLYKAAGFESVEDFALALPGEVSIPLSRMRKRIA